jgi:hypothetical protein
MELQPQDFHSDRAALALSRLAERKDVVLIRPISLTNFPGEPLTLVVWSNWKSENLTEETALDELRAGLQMYAKLLEGWDGLKDLVGTQRLPVYLHEDYGMGSIRVAEWLPSGESKWHLPRK